MLALTFNIIMEAIVFIVTAGVTASLIYAYNELRKPSVEEQMKQARNTYSTKSYPIHR